jgi:hypothetical protein
MWMPRERSTAPTAVAVFTTDLSAFADSHGTWLQWLQHDRALSAGLGP